jgi:glycosyltransferase involved in cell wall biosynthesis
MSSVKQMNLKPSVVMIVLNSVLHDSRVLREANSLLSNGYEVKIIGLLDTKMNQHYSDVEIELINVWFRYRLPRNYVGWIIKYFEFCVKCILTIIRIKPYIIHAHDLNALLPACFGSVFSKANVIYDSHELYTETNENSNTRINRVWRFVEKKLLHKVSAIIAANKSRATIMKDDYGAPYVPTVIMNIPSVQLISKSLIFQDYIKSKGVNNIDQKRIALYQGGISDNRCLDVLIRSVTSWNQKVVLILMGYGDRSYINHLKNLIYELDLQKRVFLHAAVPAYKLLQYTASADIGIVIYKNNCRNNYYCAPNKLFEYAAAKVKIAGCNFPEVTNLIHEYSLGCTFNPEDQDDIAGCINQLLHLRIDKAHYNQLFRDYNWENEEKKLLALYSKIYQKVFN